MEPSDKLRTLQQATCAALRRRGLTRFTVTRSTGTHLEADQDDADPRRESSITFTARQIILPIHFVHDHIPVS